MVEDIFPGTTLSPVVQPIVQQTAQCYLKHLRPWLACMLLHGSALKGGFIPGCSDIDFQLYLHDAAFEREYTLPLEVAIAIQRDLAQIDLGPFSYIQTYTFTTDTRIQDAKGWAAPVPGAYHVLYGALPIAEATFAQSIERAHTTLCITHKYIKDVKEDLLMGGKEKFERNLRLFCTCIWPTLYCILALQSSEPLTIWYLRKEEAIALMSANEPLGRLIRIFYHAVYAYYGHERRPLEAAFELIRTGVAFFDAVEQWYQARM